METKNSNPVYFTAMGTMKTPSLKCEYCDDPIPPERRSDSKFCSDSCKTLFCKNKGKITEGIPDENISESTISNEAENLADVKDKTNQRSQNLLPAEEKTEKWYESFANKRAFEEKILRKVAKQLKKLKKQYEKNGLSEIPKNEVFKILPVNYPVNKIDSITFLDFTLRLSTEKNFFIIYKNRTSWI